MGDIMDERRDRIEKRIQRRLKKEDSEYLNSKARITKRLLKSIVEYILVFLLITLMMDFISTGSIDIDTLPDTINTYLRPGGVIFTALIAYLPVLIISNIGLYFGLGTVGRMVFGLIKIVGIIIFLHILVTNAGDVDLVDLTGMNEGMSGVGLDAFTINIEPIVKLLDILLLLCMIIPVAEFLGARRRHEEALLRQENRKDEKKYEKTREKEKRASDKQAVKDAKAAREAEKEAKKAEKEAEKEAKKAEKQARKDAKAAEKEAKDDSDEQEKD